jgi:hypothetical protein
VLSRSSVAFKVLREIRNVLPRFSSRRIAISVNPRVAERLLSDDKSGLAQLGEELGREIEVRARPGIHQEQFEVTALDAGPPVSIPLRWLDGPKDTGNTDKKDERADPEAESQSDRSEIPQPESPEGDAGPPATVEAGPEALTGSSRVGTAADEQSDRAQGLDSDEKPDDDPELLQAGDELHSIDMDRAEVLDAEPELPILPASRKPEES